MTSVLISVPATVASFGAVTRRVAPQGTRPPPSTAGAGTHSATPRPPHQAGPVALDLAVATLVCLANGAHHRETRDRDLLHRQGFRLYWTWKSRRRSGRPTVPPDLRALIRTMSQNNPLWGAPRIYGELLKLKFDISEASVAEYIRGRQRPPSQSWRTFLANHLQQIAVGSIGDRDMPDAPTVMRENHEDEPQGKKRATLRRRAGRDQRESKNSRGFCRHPPTASLRLRADPNATQQDECKSLTGLRKVAPQAGFEPATLRLTD